MNTPLKISRILHAGYVFAFGDRQIAFDPIFENPFGRNCFAFPDVWFDMALLRQQRFSAVFISHFHDDHCSFESLDLLARETPIFLFCVHDELFHLLGELGFSNVHRLAIDSPVTVEGFTVTPRRAADAEVDSILQIDVDGLKILNVVDAIIDEKTLDELSASAPWDLVLWPFQTMLETDVIAPRQALQVEPGVPSEWIAQLALLRPRYVVASACQFIHESWSWYNQALFPISYSGFIGAIETALPRTRALRLDPSASIELTATTLRSSEPLSWIRPRGPQDVDYEFRGSSSRLSTAEIATRFAPLAPDEAALVRDFCVTELPKRVRDFAGAVDDYFDSPRVWRLTIFDHEGSFEHFHFRVAQTAIAPCPPADPEWATEIASAKLYSALTSGESLTSLYMRINDVDLPPAIEAQLRYADVLADPLIRALYKDDLFGFQRAQLAALKSRIKTT